jgi:hypothetical protein
MRFIIMVKSDESSEAGVPPTPALIAEMNELNEKATKAGIMLSGEGLHASSKGVRISLTAGKFDVKDGPFAEAKELVGGFWLIEAKSKADALDFAKRVPFNGGTVEVRPLYGPEDFPADPSVGDKESWREKEEQFREKAPTQTSRGKKKMRFMSFLKGDKDTEAGVMPKTEALEKMGAYIEDAIKAGVFLAGDGLKPTAQGARVVYDGKKRTIVDGPFAESKEIIAGYSILAVDSKEEAIEWTKRFAMVDAEIRDVPTVRCELRLLVEPEDFAR